MEGKLGQLQDLQQSSFLPLKTLSASSFIVVPWMVAQSVGLAVWKLCCINGVVCCGSVVFISGLFSFQSRGFFSSSQPFRLGLPSQNQAVFLAQESSLQNKVRKAKSWSSAILIRCDTTSNSYTGDLAIPTDFCLYVHCFSLRPAIVKSKTKMY